MAGDRAEALNEIVRLAREHGLTPSDITATLEAGAAPAPASPPASRGVVGKVFAYLGGTFVFAGIGIFIALQWSGMNAAARIIVTLGSGVAAFAMAVLASRDERYSKAAAPLFLLAGALEPTGMLVAFNELGSGGDARVAVLITCAAMALQFGAIFGGLRRGTPLFLTIFFATIFCWTALDMLDVDDELVAVVMGGSLVLAALGVDRTPHRDVAPIWYLFGSASFLYGIFDFVENTALEILFLAVAAGFVFLAATVRSRMMLFVSTVAIIAYTGWYTEEYFADAVGWPLALIAFGILLIGLSAVAVRIDRQYVRGSR